MPRITLFLLSLALLSLSVPGHAESASPKTTGVGKDLGQTKVSVNHALEVEQTKEEIIALAYQSLAQASVLHWPDLTFEISGFEHVYAKSFDDYRWGELADLPKGWLLDTTRRKQTNKAIKQSQVSFIPEWRYADGKSFDNPEAIEVFAKSVRQLTALVSKTPDTRHLATAQSFTSFYVRASGQGRERTYRASFLWLLPDAEHDFFFVVHDLITQGVEAATREQLPIQVNPDFLNHLPIAPSLAKADDDELCKPSSSVKTHSDIDVGHEFHKVDPDTGKFIGAHMSHTIVTTTCSCEDDCTSICEAELTLKICGDYGEVENPFLACHQTVMEFDESRDTVDYPAARAASCGAGLGCGMRRCIGCYCSFGIQVTVGSAGNVTISGSGTDWLGRGQDKRTCAPCVPSQDDGDPGSDGDGDGDGDDDGDDDNGSGSVSSGNGGSSGSGQGDGSGSTSGTLPGSSPPSGCSYVYCDGHPAGVACSIGEAVNLCSGGSPGEDQDDDPPVECIEEPFVPEELDSPPIICT